MEFLNGHGVRIVPSWPSHSAHMNPIENWWAHLKRLITPDVKHLLKSTPENNNKVWRAVWGAMKNCSKEYLTSLTESFFLRAKIVHESNGGLVTKQLLRQYGGK